VRLYRSKDPHCRMQNYLETYKNMIGYTAGGKKYGQLRTRQQSELESINQVSDVTR